MPLRSWRVQNSLPTQATKFHIIVAPLIKSVSGLLRALCTRCTPSHEVKRSVAVPSSKFLDHFRAQGDQIFRHWIEGEDCAERTGVCGRTTEVCNSSTSSLARYNETLKDFDVTTCKYSAPSCYFSTSSATTSTNEGRH